MMMMMMMVMTMMMIKSHVHADDDDVGDEGGNTENDDDETLTVSLPDRFRLSSNPCVRGLPWASYPMAQDTTRFIVCGILGCPYIRQCPDGLYYNQVCPLVFSLVVVVVVVVVVTSWAAPTSGSVRLDCTTTRCVPWSSP